MTEITTGEGVTSLSEQESRLLEPHLTNTFSISLCPHCGCMTYIMLDDDGFPFCGKCKEPK